MKKGLILILGIIAVALKGEAQNNEPKIVKIEIINSDSDIQGLQIWMPKTKISIGLRRIPHTDRFENIQAIREAQSRGETDFNKYKKLKLSNEFSLLMVNRGKRYDFLLTTEGLQMKLYFVTNLNSYFDTEPSLSLVKQEIHSFKPTLLNEFVLILKQIEFPEYKSTTRFTIHKIIPYDSKEYQLYNLIHTADQRIVNGLGGLRAYAAYILGPDDSPEKRREFEQKVRSASKLSQEELDKWLLDSE